jgi:hypothetical protein
MHVSHSVELEPVAYFPGSQSEHEENSSWEYVPGWQKMHTVLPLGELLPGWHQSHVAPPCLGGVWYLPAEHSSQIVLPREMITVLLAHHLQFAWALISASKLYNPN